MAHPRWRGTITGLYNCTWYAQNFYLHLETSFNSLHRYIGSIVASWVVYGCSYIDGEIGFRIPLWCQLCSSVVVAIGVWFLPESPRWLAGQDRLEDAAKVLARYHGEGSVEHPMVQLELKEMAEQIGLDDSDKRWWDYRELVNTHSARRRLICVIGMACFGQLSGNSVTSYYFPEMVKTAGINSTHTQLLLNAISPVLGFFGAVFGARMTDKIGRRPLLLYSTLFCVVCFAIIVPTSKEGKLHKNVSAANTTIAFIYLFGIVFSFGWTALQSMYIAVCSPDVVKNPYQIWNNDADWYVTGNT